MRSIAVALRSNSSSSLLELDLNSNDIHDAGATFLAAFLASTMTLQSLNLSCNFFVLIFFPSLLFF